MDTAYTDHDFTPVADRILYEDDHLLVVNKQAGEVVHKSKMTHNVSSVLIHELRALLGPDVYPVHRLDRKTSGALIFARHAEAARAIQAVFIEGQIKKTYGAIVRGFVPESFALDSPMENDRGKMQDALTTGERVRHFEIDLPHNGFDTSRYALVDLYPKTGRYHQLRKHMAHFRHPIIGDRPHGCCQQNRIWKKELGNDRMFLHARRIEFKHPLTSEDMVIDAPHERSFTEGLDILKGRNLLSV